MTELIWTVTFDDEPATFVVYANIPERWPSECWLMIL